MFLVKRFKNTSEVLISKIFPAGFCWQGASILADKMGFHENNIDFALMTGLGDGLGVFGGHMLFCSIAKKTYLPDTNLKKESQNAMLLGSAAFCSGMVWQPIVNYCHYNNMNFMNSMLTTTLICGSSFFVGLRVFRKLYNKISKQTKNEQSCEKMFTYIDDNNPNNLIKDLQLSLSIGGATGAFVGTDLSFSDNFIIPILGTYESLSYINCMLLAGKSTCLGFGIVQSFQNISTKNNWTD